jgi:hypothetical protein
MHSVSPLYAAAELKAHEHRSNHAFAEAAECAGQAAEIARHAGDSSSWWSMTFLRAQNLLDAEHFDDCATLAANLVNDASGAPSADDRARAHILLAKARQGAGLLEEAARSARVAAELTTGELDLELNINARQALIATLADGGRLAEAWEESKALANVVSDDVDDQLAGKAFWVVGNVAFLCDKVEEGLKYHELAAATFSPTKNLDIWAKFNKASAAMRLAANVADADTLRCIERAELATDVIGGSENDLLLLRRNRAHWSYLAGDATAAVELLEEIRATKGYVSPQVLGDACFLLARAYLATGNKAAARRALHEAELHFESAGAPHRAEQAREFLEAELGRDFLWTRILRGIGFHRS